jgi:hypothetical protein
MAVVDLQPSVHLPPELLRAQRLPYERVPGPEGMWLLDERTSTVCLREGPPCVKPAPWGAMGRFKSAVATGGDLVCGTCCGTGAGGDNGIDHDKI